MAIINGAYYACWIGREDLSPEFSEWVYNDGSSAGTAPSIDRVGDSYWFKPSSVTNDIIATLDSGDTNMSAVERYRKFVIRPTDATRTVVEQPTGAYRIQFYVKDENNNPVPNVTIRVYANVSGNPDRTLTNLANGYTETVNLDAVSYTVISSRSGYIFHTFSATPSGDGTITITGAQITSATNNDSQWSPA